MVSRFVAISAALGGTSALQVLHRGQGSGETLVKFLRKHCLLHFALSTEAAVSYARPSIDVLFESAAQAWGQAAIGVILTGAGRDGAQGLAAIKRYGRLSIVQAAATAECGDMPNAALATGMVDEILPLDEIAPFLAKRCSLI